MARLLEPPEIKQTIEVTADDNEVTGRVAAGNMHDEGYPLSSAQKGIYKLESLDATGITNNVPLILEIQGRLEKKRLDNALTEHVIRHESFRTSIEIVNGEPIQRVHSRIRLKINFHEIREAELDANLRELIRPFDLAKPPLFRAAMFQVDENRHILVFNMHRIAFDGMSMVTFLNELVALYREEQLPPPACQYRDYMCWQQRFLTSRACREQRAYWARVLAGELPVLDLPGDYPRPPVFEYAGAQNRHDLSPALSRKIAELAGKTEASSNMVLLAAYFILLGKYTGQEDIIIGFGTSGRPYPDLRNIVGMFERWLPIRCRPIKSKPFAQLLHEVKTSMTDAHEHQDYHLEKIVDDLKVTHDPGRNPLFDVVFMCRSIGINEASGDGVLFKSRVPDMKTARFDLMIEAREVEERLRLIWEYRTSLFSEPFIDGMAEHFENTLMEILEHPEKAIGDIDMLSRRERHLLISGFNRTEAGYPN